MSIYSKSEPGTSFHRSRFSKSISNRMDYDCQFYQTIPVLKRFVLPGDVWRIGGDVLVRFQPMRTPTLTPNNFRVRYFFVPLRLIEPNAELIITGSNDGHLETGTIPNFPNFIENADTSHTNWSVVQKHSFWDYMNVQCLDYAAIKTNECLPAAYWAKAWYRIKWDYYQDENLSTPHSTDDNFEDYYTNHIENRGADIAPGYSELPKDYFTSALPWQLKGTAPTLAVTGNATFTPNFTGNLFNNATGDSTMDSPVYYRSLYVSGDNPYYVNKDFSVDDDNDKSELANQAVKNFLNQSQSNIAVTGLGFNGDDLRTMMAETRIFERLASCGSRYTEYLKSNFGISPADGTLQRAQYLGGWKVPIVTTEVLQTAEGTDPVGTMRGHGITRGGNRINTFFAKEFGLLFGIAEIRPDIQYTTGVPRQLTYKRRFDFFNPSLQHLSEQEVRNGELFISNSDGDNDKTFGFQAYANELRSYQNETVGDMRDNLGDWNQGLAFSSRPNLNNAFIDGKSHRGSFNRPFVVQSADAYPIIVQFYNNLDVYRPMVRYATPGLVDHL